MKSIWIVLAVLVSIFCSGSYAQNDSLNTMENQIKVLQEQLNVEKNKVNKPWSGIGNEIGMAAREAIVGVVDGIDKGATVTLDHAERFAATPLGKGTIAIVAWKIIGQDIKDVMKGVWLNIMGFIFLIFTFMHIKRWHTLFFVGKMIVTKIDGKVKTLERQKPLSSTLNSEEYSAWMVVNVVTLMTLFITSCIFFYNGVN